MNIDYKDVEKVYEGAKAKEVWEDICRIAGAGLVPPTNPGGLDITGLSDTKKERIQKLLAPAEEAETVTTGKNKKEGTK